MSPVRCFLVVPTDRARLSLRRYRSQSDGGQCASPTGHGYHDAQTFVAEVSAEWEATSDVPDERFPRTDPRWPTHCACGEPFVESDVWQHFTERLWRRVDTGAENTLREFEPGVMWDAYWYHIAPDLCGPDGKAILVKLPNGHEWHIDGRASNCTMPTDTAHRCWIRHGEPPQLTVDKNGLTCAAGAGSIQAKDWHGFLRDGMLVE